MSEDSICGKCNAVISNGRVLTAMGKTWHPEHFVCKVCEKPITSSTFNEKDGFPVCSACFLQKFSQICFSCKKPIQEKVVKALGKTWHEEHFICGGSCKKPMSGTPFFERDGKPYCKQDYDAMFAAKCQGCGKPISDKAIVALDAKWHKDCFKCKRCSKPITSETFSVEDKRPICKACL